MIIEIAFVCLGFIFLVGGAELLVKGSTTIARSFGISPLVIGLTVVAFGTSAPELFVSVQGAMKGEPDVAIGNVIGSNVFNILVIIGLAAAIQPIRIGTAVTRREMPIMLFSGALLILLSVDGQLGFVDGLIFTLFIVSYLVMNYWLILRSPEKQESSADLLNQVEGHSDPAQDSKLKQLIFVLIGLGAMVFGADWIVDNAVSIASDLGVPSLVIGITLVAVGTSLPEVAATFVAARQGQSDLAVGNAIGSNIFNVFCVLGITALVSPIKVSEQVLALDYWVMFLSFIVVFAFMKIGAVVSRTKGYILISLYAAYMAFLLV